MIRKAIIVVLTLMAVGTAALNWRSYSATIRRQFRLTNKVVLFVHLSNGLSRLIWWNCEEDFVIEVATRGSRNEDFLFAITLSGCEYAPLRVAAAEILREAGISSYQIQWSKIHRPSRCPPLGAGNPLLSRGFVRTPTWTVSTIFAAYPMLAFIRGPLRRWRRHRKGLCLKCGYNLEGNVSGVCPECGEAR